MVLLYVFAHAILSGHTNSILALEAALTDLTVQSTPLLGAALQGSSADGNQCYDDNECGSGWCQNVLN